MMSAAIELIIEELHLDTSSEFRNMYCTLSLLGYFALGQALSVRLPSEIPGRDAGQKSLGYWWRPVISWSRGQWRKTSGRHAKTFHYGSRGALLGNLSPYQQDPSM